MGGTRGVPGLRKPEPRLEPREKSIRARRIAGTQDHRTQGLQNSGPPYQGSALTECGHRIYRSTSRTTDPRRTIQWSEDPPATYRRRAQDRARAELTPLFSLQENPRPSYFLAEKIILSTKIILKKSLIFIGKLSKFIDFHRKTIKNH